MFTGIIRNTGLVHCVDETKGNIELWIKAEIAHQIQIDQSIAHNGICLTVVEIVEDMYRVTAIPETRKKTTIDTWVKGDVLNLEFSLAMGDKLDGHQVQGHVDTIATCTSKEMTGGSWNYRFKYDQTQVEYRVVNKGSIAINGISLTVVDPTDDEIGVSIIPYTYENTNMRFIERGSVVNLEFDIIGKYIEHYLKRYGLVQ
ncbi:MAG: riboflavin synthase [Bacteroidota bacterium]